MPRETKPSRYKPATKSSHCAPPARSFAAILLGVVVRRARLWAMDWLAERRQEVEQMTSGGKRGSERQIRKIPDAAARAARTTPRACTRNSKPIRKATGSAA